MTAALYDLLCCPSDHGDLTADDRALTCTVCSRRYPRHGNIVSFLESDDLAPVDRDEQAARDAEAAWYDTIFDDYTNAAEVPSTVAPLAGVVGPILDHGCGTGRVTAALLETTSQPILALDYSMEALRILEPRIAGRNVLAVHADGRYLPIKPSVLAGVVSAEVYEHFRDGDRRQVLAEFNRVLQPGAPLSVSSLNFSVVFRLWKLKGNKGAKEGDHLFGQNFYYIRQTSKEFGEELRQLFDVESMVGVRNIPARTLASLVGRIAGSKRGDAVLNFMTRRGYKVDLALQHTPLSHWLGFFLLAKARKRARS